MRRERRRRRSKRLEFVGVLAALALVACESAEPRETAVITSPSAAADDATPAAALDRTDERSPLPLLPMMALHQKQNMREHLVAVQRIVTATGRRDFEEVAAAAEGIGYSESTARRCEHMGAQAPGFTELALTFHHTADGIGEAAKHADQQAVLTALGDTLALCTTCHATYKQKIVATLPD